MMPTFTREEAAAIETLKDVFLSCGKVLTEISKVNAMMTSPYTVSLKLLKSCDAYDDALEERLILTSNTGAQRYTLASHLI